LFGSGYTTEGDAKYLGNEDFVFFRVEAGVRPTQTRFGSTVIALDIQDIERLGGWISLHDELWPLTPGTMKSLVHNGQVIRRGEYVQMRYRGSWLFTYYGQGSSLSEHRVDFQDEVFFGEDSLEGLALSVLEEINRIGGEFRKEIFEAEDVDNLWRMISRLFRPEAKIPSGPLMNIGEEIFSDGFLPLSIQNPDGGYLYLPDGTINTNPSESYVPPSRPYPAVGEPLADDQDEEG
jgi:hypothetical protein